MVLHKDLVLGRLAEFGNVAQFVAFRPDGGGLRQSTSCVAGFEQNHRFASVSDAVGALLELSGEKSVNVRSYLPEDPRSKEFVYGIATVSEAIGHIDRLSRAGLHLIVNETVDINDGGVSGVAEGAVIEFAPDDTPRAVEKPDVASFPRQMGLDLLQVVYGFVPDLPSDEAARVEFSIHPLARGWKRSHTLLWEIEAGDRALEPPVPRWPNRFSHHIGDKTFGLLVASSLGATVPETLVISRRVAPFRFGNPTGSEEVWLRTAPREPQPGLFTTTRGWIDPFKLLSVEDPNTEIAAVLSQCGVHPQWSGAAIIGDAAHTIVEGRAGRGDEFMLGIEGPETLPVKIVEEVSSLHANLVEQLGPVRIEWVHDGRQPWIVQLHLGATSSGGDWLVRGEAENWVSFDAALGLAQLRMFLNTAADNVGLLLHGDIGYTSHIADVIRKWGRPARVIR